MHSEHHTLLYGTSPLNRQKLDSKKLLGRCLGGGTPRGLGPLLELGGTLSPPAPLVMALSAPPGPISQKMYAVLPCGGIGVSTWWWWGAVPGLARPGSADMSLCVSPPTAGGQ